MSFARCIIEDCGQPPIWDGLCRSCLEESLKPDPKDLCQRCDCSCCYGYADCHCVGFCNCGGFHGAT